jgi:hypothetical protein
MKVALLFLIAIVFPSCAAHNYFYLPVIQGAGEKEPKGKISYEVPKAKSSVSLLSLGVKKRENQPMLGIRFTLDRAAGLAPEIRMNPGEQKVRFGEAELSPKFVRARVVEKGLVQLREAHEVIELLYPLPAGREDGGDLPSFNLNWNLELGAKGRFVQITRFDRYDAAPQQAGSAYSDDPNYPYGQNPWGLPAWNTGQPYWAPYPYGIY